MEPMAFITLKGDDWRGIYSYPIGHGFGLTTWELGNRAAGMLAEENWTLPTNRLPNPLDFRRESIAWRVEGK